MRQRDLPGLWHIAPAHKPLCCDRVVRTAERALLHQPLSLAKHPGHTVDFGEF